MTIQGCNSDSGLFRFIHDCRHPVNDMAKGSKQVDETGRGGTVKSGDIRAMFANPKKPSKKIIVEI